MADRCSARSSVTGVQCVLEEGHQCWSPTRFHRFSAPDQTPHRTKIAFDVGGVLSKHRSLLVLYDLLHKASMDGAAVDVFVISDMHPVEKIKQMLDMNFVMYHPDRVLSSDYQEHGERCKAVLCEEHGIDVLIDDFPGYVADGDHARLLVMPNTSQPYYHPDWRTDGSEGNFGRRLSPKEVKPPAPKLVAYRFENGMVMCFDENTQQQVPEFQGRETPELRTKLRNAGAEMRGFGVGDDRPISASEFKESVDAWKETRAKEQPKEQA